MSKALPLAKTGSAAAGSFLSCLNIRNHCFISSSSSSKSSNGEFFSNNIKKIVKRRPTRAKKVLKFIISESVSDLSKLSLLKVVAKFSSSQNFSVFACNVLQVLNEQQRTIEWKTANNLSVYFQ